VKQVDFLSLEQRTGSES